ncbi:MAG TPA: hypothetical protein VNI20_00705 [Fimbriimonadaceae bacterium]|nr:hypothetical protein [Fimbriimonadaceae bacterium]
MSFVEGAIVFVAVSGAVYMVVRQFIKPFGSAKGSCRACGEVCSCEQTESKKKHDCCG